MAKRIKVDTELTTEQKAQIELDRKLLEYAKSSFFHKVTHPKPKLKRIIQMMNRSEEIRKIELNGKFMDKKETKEFNDTFKELERVDKTEILGELYVKASPMNVQFALTKKSIRKQNKFYKKNIGKIVLIKMELGNGQFREFLASDQGGFFYFNKNQYIFDYEMKYYLIERNIWAYDYHEFLSLPIRKRFDISDKLEKELQPKIDSALKRPIPPPVDTSAIRTLIEESKLIDVEASINPTTLKRFTDSEVIKQVLQGTMLGKIFKIMFILIIVVAVFVFMLLLINLYSSGIFEQIKNMFHRG